MNLPSPLESILNDIHRAIEAKLYYPALAVSLSLPDICVALTFTRDQFVKSEHYIAFVDKYAFGRGIGLTGEECYRLRGGVLHRANAAGHAYFQGTHMLVFVGEGGLHGLTAHVDDKSAACLHLECFCSGMLAGVHAWYADHKDDPVVRGNLPKLLSLRPDGVPPFVKGQPVIASEA